MFTFLQPTTLRNNVPINKTQEIKNRCCELMNEYKEGIDRQAEETLEIFASLPCCLNWTCFCLCSCCIHSTTPIPIEAHERHFKSAINEIKDFIFLNPDQPTPNEIEELTNTISKRHLQRLGPYKGAISAMYNYLLEEKKEAAHNADNADGNSPVYRCNVM